jgi:two-component system cell cycle sensor histidine kinase/response regulator CckA
VRPGVRMRGTEEKRAARAEPCSTGTVLVADDEELVLRVTENMLQSVGYEVVTATNGKKAVEELRRRTDSIGAVVLDATMPVMDGYEAFEELRRIRPGVGVVFTSGYAQQEISGRFAEEKNVCFLQKPYELEQLLDALCCVMET